MSAFPIVSAPSERSPSTQPNAKGGKRESGDPHLRSTKAIIRYHIQATDEVFGHVTDFVLDDKDWTIRQVVMDTRHWLQGKRVMISPNQINRIDWNESKVYVDLTNEGVLGSPVFDPASFAIRFRSPTAWRMSRPSHARFPHSDVRLGTPSVKRTHWMMPGRRTPSPRFRAG
jgi:hypothetical protein